jgi:hypothetical protein
MLILLIGAYKMKLQRLFIALLIFSALIYSGCATNPTGSDIASPSAPTGSAGLNVVLAPETLASIRAASTIYTIKVTILIANPGNSTTPYHRLVKEIDIDTTAKSAAASFSGLPAKPVVVQVVINNASISGARLFHGATDLADGETRTLSPDWVGSGSKTDLVARVALEFFNNPSLMAAANDTLTATISAISGQNEFSDLLNAAIVQLAPTGLVKFEKDPANASTLKIGELSKTAAEILAGGILWSSTPESATVKGIARQGLGGYGLIHWEHPTDKDTCITRINTADGSRSAYCRNYGKLSHFILLKDGSLLVAGFNDAKSAPVIFRWNATGDASTYSNQGSGPSDSGLQWSNYFTELGTDLSGYSLEAVITDYETIAFIILKDAGGNRVEYRLNLSSGARILVPGSVTEGLQIVTAYYPELRAVLEDNSMTETQRVSKFMTYIAEDFKNIAGTADKKSDLESVTLERFEKYNIVEYKFNLLGIKALDSSTIEATTEMFIKVQTKSTYPATLSTNTLNPKIVWKNYNGSWKIYQGLPYTASELDSSF